MVGLPRFAAFTAAALMAALILAAYAPLVASAQQLTVSFNSPVYDRDSVVTMVIQGYKTPATIAVEVVGPQGQLVWAHEADSVTTSTLTLSFKLLGVPDGLYTVYVALKGEPPVKAQFLVRRPTFRILYVSQTAVETAPGAYAATNITVLNTGAPGSFYIRVAVSNGTLVESLGPYGLGYGQQAPFEVAVKAPEKPGTYTYRIEIYNAKYHVVDASATLQVVVKPVSTATTTTPPMTVTTTAPPPRL